MSDTLRGEVLHSLKWVALGKAASQIVRWLMTFWVIRLLTPDDYGLVAMADVAFGFLTLVLGALFGPFLIQSKELSQETIRQVFGFTLIAHTVIFAAQFSAAPALAAYFKSPVIADILRVNAVCFLILAFETVPAALLTRSMKFKQISVIAAISNGVAAITTLVLAYLGHGFWALVLGEISFLLVRTALTLYVQPITYLPRFSGRDARTVLSFGSLLSVHALLVYVFLHVDVAIAGRVMSPGEIGLYAIALQVALMPQKKIMPMLRAVAFPAFSRVQDRPGDIRHYLMKAQRLCLLTTVPVFWGMALVADSAIPLILGERWTGAIVPSVFVLAVMPLRFCAELFTPALKSQRRVREMIINSLIAVGVMTIAILLGSQRGAAGLAMAWAFGFPLAFAWIAARNIAIFGISVGQLFALFRSPAIAGATMIAAVLLTKHFFPASGVPLLVLQVSAGAAAYAGVLIAFDRASVREILSLRA